MTTRAALIISDLQGGDYQVALVDEERFLQIQDALAKEENFAAVEGVSYMLLPAKDADRLHAEHPDMYPERRGQILGTKFTQDLVLEPSDDWPEVHIFSILTVPDT
jgi:hypothetical protein